MTNEFVYVYLKRIPEEYTSFSISMYYHVTAFVSERADGRRKRSTAMKRNIPQKLGRERVSEWKVS